MNPTPVPPKPTIEDKASSNARLLEAIRKAHTQFIEKGTIRDLFEYLLDSVLSLTQSKFGFIGEVRKQGSGNLYLKIYAITDIAWNEETRKFFDDMAPKGMEFHNLKTLFGEVIVTGKTVISNNPKEDPRASGLPEGHPPLDSFLGIPFYHGAEIIGMVGIANRPEGYDLGIAEYLEPFIASCSSLLMGFKDKQRRQEAEDKLRSRLSCEEGISEMAHFLFAADLNRPDPLSLALNHLRRAAQVSRICLFENYVDSSDGDLRSRVVVETKETKQTSEKGPLSSGNFSYAQAGLIRWQNMLSLGEIVSGDSRKLPEREKEFLKDQGIRSVLLIPIFVEADWYGFLRLDEPEENRAWDFEDVRILKTAAEILGGYMSKKKTYLQLKQYSAELERSNQELNDFASIASHDLKEPLRKIIMFSDRLQGTLHVQEPGAVRSLDRIQYAARRMQRYIDDLLKYSRINTQDNSVSDVDLEDLIQEVLGDLEGRLRDTQGQIRVHELPVIRANGFQMRQLFLNLISNALKFHFPNESPKVEISFLNEGGRTFKIEVRDNGIGFDTKYLERIFRPFDRLHRQEDYEGTGMGLAICKKIMVCHDGTIEVHSVPGKGSRFQVQLPALSLVSLPGKRS